MSNEGFKELFKRYEGNPILTPEDWPYEAGAVFNPG
ncbi:MAG: glycosidase, partial [Actinobacteria bacterium]|nr:glycosidase [Actinomycetota bacterium]